MHKFWTEIQNLSEFIDWSFLFMGMISIRATNPREINEGERPGWMGDAPRSKDRMIKNLLRLRAISLSLSPSPWLSDREKAKSRDGDLKSFRIYISRADFYIDDQRDMRTI